MKESTWEQQPAFTVETVSLDEWALYKDLWLDALTTDPQAFAYSLDTVSQWDEVAWKTDIQKSFRENARTFVAKTPNAYIGMMGYYQKGDHEVRIFGVYVRSAFREHGVGAKMMQVLLDSLSRNRNITTVSLSVNKQQESAIAFYTHCGFDVIDVQKEATMGDHKTYPMFVMQKNITPTISAPK